MEIPGSDIALFWNLEWVSNAFLFIPLKMWNISLYHSNIIYPTHFKEKIEFKQQGMPGSASNHKSQRLVLQITVLITERGLLTWTGLCSSYMLGSRSNLI